MVVELRALTPADAEAHHAGEDEATVRWLSGGRSTLEGTRQYLEHLAASGRSGTGKQAFGVDLDGRLAGYVDYDPDVEPHDVAGHTIGPGDVSLAYAVHPWARGRGVAVEAVRLLCDRLRAEGIGGRAFIKVEPENTASVRVAQKVGFRYLGEVEQFEAHLGHPVLFGVHVLDL